MPYEVFSPFTRCAEIHGTHSNLEEAACCYSKILAARDGQMRSWKHTGKHVHVIGAIDRNGNLRAFLGKERMHAQNLNLPPEAILTEKGSITTFYNFAKMFYEASMLFPISSVSLEGMFDYEARDKHFWSTEAGMGQGFRRCSTGCLHTGNLTQSTFGVPRKTLVSIHAHKSMADA